MTPDKIAKVLNAKSVSVYGTFNISLPQLPSLDNLPFFGTTTTVRPIVIINQPSPPNHYQNHHHHQHNQNYNNGGYYLVLERTEVPYVNNNFLNNVQFQIQRINSTVAACVGTFNLRQHVQGATLVVRLYSCQSQQQCNPQYLSEIPRRPLCQYLIGYQQYQQYGGSSPYGIQGRSSCSSPPYQQQQNGCSLPEGTYQFVNYVPLNVVPQQIPGQRWRMDCYMAVSGRRIATFSLYARCGSTNDNFISGSSTNTQPLIITNALQVAQFERLTATAVNSIEENNDTEVTTIVPEAFSVS
ncbi:uncharacterized protein LOC123292161 [Chrysoperla carnea]|uniref:uncharacterized protein LOC123292161 n=1 Tax=Chrysoperla carnea TaxID=189513 RepID=UPI001D091117|nr:uncharacterized protein LOC123292161 [Chrysoperla carnea]